MVTLLDALFDAVNINLITPAIPPFRRWQMMKR
jgi:hypothetical protein